MGLYASNGATRTDDKAFIYELQFVRCVSSSSSFMAKYQICKIFL